jgi:hypothetical protein
MEIKKIEINKLKPATYNPRQITTKQYNDLKKSIEKFGIVDPIIINKNGNVVIGGHQRLKICTALKYKEIDCVVLDLSKEEERELNVRLNKNTGEFDIDILANEFDIDELVDWGFKHIDLGLNIDKINYEKEWEGMPEFKQDDKMPHRQIIISFENDNDIKRFSELLSQNITDKTKSLWYPKKEKNVLKNKGYE